MGGMGRGAQLHFVVKLVVGIFLLSVISLKTLMPYAISSQGKIR